MEEDLPKSENMQEIIQNFHFVNEVNHK